MDRVARADCRHPELQLAAAETFEQHAYCCRLELGQGMPAFDKQFHPSYRHDFFQRLLQKSFLCTVGEIVQPDCAGPLLLEGGIAMKGSKIGTADSEPIKKIVSTYLTAFLLA